MDHCADDFEDTVVVLEEHNVDGHALADTVVVVEEPRLAADTVVVEPGLGVEESGFDTVVVVEHNFEVMAQLAFAEEGVVAFGLVARGWLDDPCFWMV